MRNEGQFPVDTLQTILCGRDVTNPAIGLTLIVKQIVTVVRWQALCLSRVQAEQAKQAKQAGQRLRLQLSPHCIDHCTALRTVADSGRARTDALDRCNQVCIINCCLQLSMHCAFSPTDCALAVAVAASVSVALSA